MKRLLFFIFLFGSFLLADKVFALTINCPSIPSQVPLNGTISPGACSIHAGWLECLCLFGRSEIRLLVRYYRYIPPSVPGGDRWMLVNVQEYSCDGCGCNLTSVLGPFDVIETLQIEFCGQLRCYRFGGVEIRETVCLPRQTVEVLPPQCGDGVVNQSNEECDDGNTNSGDGCDATCHLEGPTPPTQPTTSPARAGFDNPLIWRNVLQFLLYILRFTFQIVLGVSILMVVLSGFFLAISRADPTRQEKGKRTLMYALIGFSIAFLANGLFLLFKIIFGVQIP